jgi:hypothetical protein
MLKDSRGEQRSWSRCGGSPMPRQFCSAPWKRIAVRLCIISRVFGGRTVRRVQELMNSSQFAEGFINQLMAEGLELSEPDFASA